ncbi:rhomboid family intramembrane serine protease [Flavobacterium capsici]|uniref:Rhomboid family intramembrane serine protease n=2 Tax=Flavobacterium capsici TaxID=3075618 RepID=A0AA96F510_9FLAO|nr:MULTISPECIES: rhomboid family intramembrane serine protease [unclassified Flavobacterium]WNM18842.1 rhomboid family intramembrane serine protease [Flavobacterium sp. PMR2A8]WNM22892.1 rhomboid family intramembrane serine protease [Flavobacterium sp. PMTSA4]
MMRMTETVKQLLIINIIFYIGSQFVDLAYPLFSLYYPENDLFRFWQPITSMFMHAPMPNLMHIVFNMFGLIMFGSPLEHFWGTKKFLFFYISCGLGAALLHLGFSYYEYNSVVNSLKEAGISDQVIGIISREGKYNQEILNVVPLSKLEQLYASYNIPSLGASGAIYGLLTAFAFMFPNAELMMLFIPVPIKAKYFVPGLIALDLFLGLKGNSLFGSGGTGVAHFAHIGGAITGFIMMWFWKKNQFNKNRWD